MTIRAVVFDIGGVPEKVGPPQSWIGPWLDELSLTAGDLGHAIERAAPAGRIETGALTEPEYRARIAAELGLTPGQERRFFAGMWDWYCGIHRRSTRRRHARRAAPGRAGNHREAPRAPAPLTPAPLTAPSDRPWPRRPARGNRC